MRWTNIQFMLFSVICFLQMFYKIKTLIENEIISLQKERWEVKEKKAKRSSKWQTKERKQEVEEERKEKYWEEERCREGERARKDQFQLVIQSVFSVSESSKNHQSLRFGDSKVGSISNHFPQPFKVCQTFICFGLM